MKLKRKTFQSIFFIPISQDQIRSKLKIHLYLPTDEFVKTSRLIYFLFYLQIRDRLKRMMNTVFPAVFDENPAKKTITSQGPGNQRVKRSHVGVPKKIEVLPYPSNKFELKQ